MGMWITRAECPRARSSSAAFSPSLTMIPVVTRVTSFPSRSTFARPMVKLPVDLLDHRVDVAAEAQVDRARRDAAAAFVAACDSS